jgi:4-oxalocrotonate tautomerase
MPVIRITMSPGCTAGQKSALIEELTMAFVRTCNGVRERVTVIIEEVPRSHWGIGGKVVGPPPAGTGGSIEG